jgi:hypothetical protein
MSVILLGDLEAERLGNLLGMPGGVLMKLGKAYFNF